MRGSDKPPSCAPCPLYTKSSGFSLDCGDPLRAKYALILEAPGRDEIAYRLLEPRPHDPERERYDRAEYERRKRAYPGVPDQYLRKGMALVGKSWGIMAQWCFKRLGIKREDLYIGNVLRCLPQKNAKGGDAYPTGDDRKRAELCCRQYDAPLKAFNPAVMIITIHPASLTRSITPLPLLIRSCEKLRDCGVQGIKAALLCGGKSVKAWLGYYDSVTRFQGHYTYLPRNWYGMALGRLRAAGEVKERKARTPRAGRRVSAAGGVKNLLGE